MERGSGSLYSDLVTIMVRYLSRTSVESTLGVSADRLGISLENLEPREVENLVAQAMIGLRIFCNPDRLPDLMLDLADYCERVVDESEARTSGQATVE